MKLSMARVSVSSCKPRFFENLLAERRARRCAPDGAAVRFHEREMNNATGGAQFERAEVDGLAVERKCSSRRAGHSAARWPGTGRRV